MELGLALGFSARYAPLVDAPRTVVLGARDASILEAEGVPSIRDRVRVVDASRFNKTNARALTKEALAKIKKTTSYFWLHVDLDVLSTEALSAVDYRQPGGLDWESLLAITQQALATDGLLGWNVTIYNPDLDPEHKDAHRIVEYILTSIEQAQQPRF